MLPKQYRFSARARLEHPFIINNPLFTMRIARNNLDTSRFCVVVPKKVDKRAVIRNKTKRMVLQAIQGNLIFVRKGSDILLHIKKSLEDEKSVGNELKDSLKKGGVLL